MKCGVIVVDGVTIPTIEKETFIDFDFWLHWKSSHVNLLLIQFLFI
ncbi:hypothetical protein MtrunA17_Chr7g0252161 [Medicago truncatula]|uniref:Uncharacterized protein n=1 Tax=Medicago truncatula TaxID=3880 RepID=A0A396H287_MEDTR|nr:hypothetical protein MtrunA17_Chr7g0252161 [Medicago truncatula]